MKYVDEYRDPQLAASLVAKIRSVSTRRWTLMEVCGGQTHGLLRHGIDEAHDAPPTKEGVGVVRGRRGAVGVVASGRGLGFGWGAGGLRIYRAGTGLGVRDAGVGDGAGARGCAVARVGGAAGP